MFSVINAVSLSALCQGKGPKKTEEDLCVGCFQPIPMDSSDLKPVLKHAVEHFNNNTKHTHLFALTEVKSAHSQVCCSVVHDMRYCSDKEMLVVPQENREELI